MKIFAMKVVPIMDRMETQRFDETMQVIETLRDEIDLLRAENLSLRSRFRSVSLADLFCAAVVFAWGYLTHVWMGR